MAESTPTGNVDTTLDSEPTTSEGIRQRNLAKKEDAVDAGNEAYQIIQRIRLESLKLCCFHSLPQWMRDNEYILRYHRPQLHNYWDCIRSIFHIHSETYNIWTHLLFCLIFVVMAISCLTANDVTWQKFMIFFPFFTGAIVCLGLSTAFHIFYCHSEPVARILGKLDYCGISLLISGSYIPWLYGTFYCNLRHQLMYLFLVLTLGCVSIGLSLWDRFGEPSFRTLRALVFLAFGLSAVVPVLHYVIERGWVRALTEASLGWVILMGGLYVGGTSVYVLRIPERFFPGSCDIWPQSHQIFHVLVGLGAYAHYRGIIEINNFRRTHGWKCVDTTMIDG